MPRNRLPVAINLIYTTSVRYHPLTFTYRSETEFLNFKEPMNRFQGTNSARLCSLAGRYDNPIPSRFLAPIDCLKIPALYPK
jgi:hypothetical protein